MALLTTICHQFEEQGIRCQCGEPLSRHTTFKIGGPAGIFATVSTQEQLAFAMRLCKQENVRSYILGNGSNVLFSDAGYDGVILHPGAEMGKIAVKDNAITAGAAAQMGKVSYAASSNNLTGLEFAVGIPGSIGGGIYMNAGAYGGEIRDVLQQVTFLDEDANLRTLPAEELELGYRKSIFARKKWYMTEAVFCLREGSREESEAKMRDFMQRRKDKQPLEWPSAGSTFKRPEGAFAAALIEQCGLKGYRVGGAAISEKHSGFVINLGGATCADVIRLTEDVARIVKEQTGFQLEREVRVIE